VIATYAPKAEIFAKDYLPPVKASMLSEIKAIEVPLDFIKGLPLSQRKSKSLWNPTAQHRQRSKHPG
jgi:hypothetical protein